MRAAFSLLVLLALAGCVQSGTPESTAMRWRTLDVGDHSAIGDPTRALLLDEASWDDLWARHAQGQPRPAVDFPREVVIAIVLGERSVGCWAVRVTDVRLVGQEAVVDVVVYDEGRAGECAGATTSAYHLVAVEGRPGGARFSETRVTGKAS